MTRTELYLFLENQGFKTTVSIYDEYFKLVSKSYTFTKNESRFYELIFNELIFNEHVYRIEEIIGPDCSIRISHLCLLMKEHTYFYHDSNTGQVKYVVQQQKQAVNQTLFQGQLTSEEDLSRLFQMIHIPMKYLKS